MERIWRLGNPAEKEPKIGQSVTVYYNPRSPDENSLTDHNELSDSWSGTAWGVSVFAGLVLLGIFAAERLMRQGGGQ